jgi:hypothetical protein
MLVSMHPSRDSRPDEPRLLIHGPILIHSFTDPARVAPPLCTARPCSRDDSTRPRRPHSDRLFLRRSRALPPPALPTIAGRTPLSHAALARGTDSACAARRRRPCRQPSRLAPPITVVLHPPAAATAEVRAAGELRTGELRALRGIELWTGVKLHKDELHWSKQQGDITLKTRVASVCFKYFS